MTTLFSPIRRPLLLLTSVLLLAAAVQAEPIHFGTAVKPELKVEVAKVLAQPEQYQNKEITIEGTVDSVCTKKGCWMQILTADKSDKLRVKVKDGDMVFPVSAKGRPALVTGTLTGREMSLEQSRNYQAHLAEDAGESFDPSTVTAATTLYQLVPTGVTILDKGE